MFAAGEGDGDLLGVRLGLFEGLGLPDAEDDTDAEGDGEEEAELLTEAEGVSEGVVEAASVVGTAEGSDSPAACRAALGWTSSG
ncbi:hypothetical protein Ait01nite_019560 [Actinoplanes italicus]|nr:hypothetical protein Ait01nite_019560 [Actinoplanes italicus]